MPASLCLERSERITEAPRFGGVVSKPKGKFSMSEDEEENAQRLGCTDRFQPRGERQTLGAWAVQALAQLARTVSPVDADTKNTMAIGFQSWNFDHSGHLFGTPRIHGMGKVI